MTEQHRIPMSIEELMAAARDRSDIDRMDEDAVEPLTVLTQSLNEDGNLHESGAHEMQEYLVRILTNRLRMQRDFAEHPGIREQQVHAPLFLWGMPRTGSTKAQKLLSATGDFNYLTFWQSHNPALITSDPDESTILRVEEADEFVRWFRTASPDTKNTHPLKTHEPEEETFLLMHSLRTPTFIAFADVSSYLGWLATQDMTAQFSYLKDGLKYLQWQGQADSNKPWVLKSPLSYGMEAPVLNQFPDANLVMTHRHPVQTIPSFCSTIASYYKPFSNAPINYETKIGQLIYGLSQHLAYRQTYPETEILDVDYRELVTSINALANRIYQFCDKALKPGSLERMRDWDKNNPKDKSGAHRYSLEDFGLTEDAVNEQFSGYISLIHEKFGM